MTYRTLEINVVSAKGLKIINENVNLIDKMDVYAIISLKSGNSHKQEDKTPVDKDCGKDPTWNFLVKFTVDESLAKNNHLNLEFKIKCERIHGDKELGRVEVPVKELLDSPGEGNSMKFVSYQVRRPSGEPEGILNFSFKLGDKVSEPVKPGKTNGVTAYPAHVAEGSSSGQYPNGAPGPYTPPQPAGYGYPPQLAPAVYGGYPPQAPPPGYGYPPPPQGYGYPPPAGYGYLQQAPPPGYGYPPPPRGYGYAPPPRGYGYHHGGLVDGLLIGGMVYDAAAYADDAAAYAYDAAANAYDDAPYAYDDAIYDDGYDAGCFDF